MPELRMQDSEGGEAMMGGERICSKCVHGPTQRECDVREQASKTFAQMPYGGMYCGYMKRKPIAARVGSTARRWVSEALEIKRKR